MPIKLFFLPVRVGARAVVWIRAVDRELVGAAPDGRGRRVQCEVDVLCREVDGRKGGREG